MRHCAGRYEVGSGDDQPYAVEREHWFEMFVDGEWIEVARKPIKISDSHRMASALCVMCEKAVRYSGVPYAVYRCEYIGNGESKTEIEV